MHKASHHSPSGVMGGEYHKQGEFMFSIRQMSMSMEKNSNQGTRLTDQEIISLPNPFQNGSFSPNLSVVPKNMNMQMSMLEGMYGLTDKYTLMFMAVYISQDMNLNTYTAMANRSYIGSFKTQTSDLSNLSLSSLIEIKETKSSNLHLEIGLVKSIGANDSEDEVLSPMNMNMKMRLPYAMQIGDIMRGGTIGVVEESKNEKFKKNIKARRGYYCSSW